jgi:predicted permease
MDRFILSLSIIAAGLGIGYAIQRIVRPATEARRLALARARRVLQLVAMLGISPAAGASAIWGSTLTDPRMAFLPLLGVLTFVTGGAAGLAGGRLLKLGRRQAGAFFTSSAMSNVGAIGSLVVFLLIGEAGFALVPFYRLFEEFVYYSFAFPIARSFSPIERVAGIRVRNRWRTVANPFVLVALASIGIGFSLNLTGVPRPYWFSAVNAFLIPTGSLLLLISIGMAMQLDRLQIHVPTAFGVAAIKFLVMPAVAVGMTVALGLHSLEDGRVIRVVAILASMPTGFMALVPPSLYDLDQDLANACWLTTTALLVIVIPVHLLVGILAR